jgi:aspartyl-tRNA(Asn)/glutamyl-tRNA(Gln) amidotransferase subunit B
VANLLMSEVGGRLKALGIEQEQSPVSMAGIVLAADLLDEDKISSKQLKQLFDVCFEKGEDFGAVYEREKPQQITDTSALEKLIDEVDCGQPQTGGAISRRQENHGRLLCWPGDARLKRPGQSRRCSMSW